MTLAQDMPWADSVTGADPYVDYRSNLAGAQDYLRYLAPQVPQTLSEFADMAALEEAEGSAREVGAVAGVFLGAFAIPLLLQNFSARGEYKPPMRPGFVLAGMVAGGLLGYWKPLTANIVQGVFLMTELG